MHNDGQPPWGEDEFVESPLGPSREPTGEMPTAQQPAAYDTGWYEDYPPPLPQPLPSRRAVRLKRALLITGIATVISAGITLANPSSGKVALTIALVLSTFFIGLRALRGPYKDVEDRYTATLREGLDQATVPERIRRVLNDTEQVMWVTRSHPLSLWRWWVASSGVVAVASAIGAIAGNPAVIFVAIIGVTLVMGVRIYDWTQNWVALTDKRIVAVYGLVKTTVADMPLAKMTDSKVITPYTSKILTWCGILIALVGTFVMESAGQDQALTQIRWIPYANPRHVRLKDFALPS